MKNSIFVLVSTVFLVGMLSLDLAAQTTADRSNGNVDQSLSNAGPPAVDSSNSSVEDSNSNDSTQASSVQQTETTYVPALNASGLIALDETLRTQLLVGANYSSGWDSNPAQQHNGAGTGTILFSPYIGVQISSANTQAVLQYQPTIQRYPFSQFSSGAMNLASATIAGRINDRWHWDFNGSGNYGDDYIRQLAPSQTEAVGNVPGASSNTAMYLPGAGTVTYANGEADARYSISARNTIEVQGSNSYSKSSGFQQNAGGTSSVMLDYHHMVTPLLALSAYTQSLYSYGLINCNSFGGGVRITWQPRADTTLDLSGGPQLGAGSCSSQSGFAYSAAYNTRLTGSSQIYATSSRQTIASYLGQSQWLEASAVGYQREFSRANTLSADIGYVNSDSVLSTASYHNLYVDGVYSKHIGRALSFSISYRNYSGTLGAASYTRHIALISLSWSPMAGHLFQ